MAGSGWQYSGSLGGFLAYPIAPNYFIAARHVGSALGPNFVFNGVIYTSDAQYPAPGSTDLRIFHVTTDFPSWTPLYTKSDELGKDYVMFGMGAKRGDPVTVAGASPTDERGWLWGTQDTRKRWGQNTVEDIDNLGGSSSLLLSYFDRGGLAEEATVSSGDSSGGVFIKDGGTWKLAGLLLGVQAQFTKPPSTTPFFASIYDMGGLHYVPDNLDIPDQATDIPALFASTRISSNLGWIMSVIPEAAAPPWIVAGLMVSAAAGVGWRRIRRA